MSALPALPLLEVDLGVGVRAGFTIRAGGVGIGRFSSANLSEMVGDEPRAVTINRARLAAWAGAPVGWHRQIHGTAVAAADEDQRAADAVIGGAGQPVAVLVADCLPVLLADPDVPVVAAAHAGRRGLAAGVLQATVAAMLARGARPDRIRAVVGPGICGRCYEVPAAMQYEVATAVPGTASLTRAGTTALDLPNGALTLLRDLGVGRVVDLGICTAEDPRFFSHRGDGGTVRPTGRSAGIAVAEPPPGVANPVGGGHG